MDRNEGSELGELLREWQAPEIPASLEERLFGKRRHWWQASVRIPLPVACCAVLLIAMGWWRWTQTAKPIPERVVVRTERVGVPMVRERVVTKIVYRNRPARQHEHEHGLTFTELRPVNELKVRIVRHQDAAKN